MTASSSQRRARWSTRLRAAARPWSTALASLDPRAFYIALAVVLGAWVVATNLFDREHHREASTYDWMLAHRFRVPQPDPDIVLLDIDERSLAAMAPDYGQWPWPRDVLATVLAELEHQGAKAVVFDILFADADLRNPVSERAFEEAVARSRVTYFPVLRLSRDNDAKSALHAGDLAGLVVSRSDPHAPLSPGTGPTLALVLPYFGSVVKSGRLGTHNVDPDPDSLIRRYRMFEDVGDFRILSLPARLALDFGWALPDADEKTLRFNDRALAYRTVAFSDVFTDLLKKQRSRPPGEFARKIVVIGATASGLFDQKGTPISRTHPGMDILATAIDDTKNARFIDELGAPADIAIALLLLVLMTWLCIRYSHEQLRLAFVIAPGLLFGISYLSLNLSHTFVDLASPASIAFVYFSLVKLYSAQVRRRWSEGELFAPLLEPAVEHWVACLATSLPPNRQLGHAFDGGFETRYLNLLRTVAPHVRITSGLDAQSWLGNAFSGVLVATWVERSDDPVAIARARAESRQLLTGLRSLCAKGAIVPMRFLEEIVAAEPAAVTVGAGSATIVPPRLNRLRALVSRTVLQMSEGVSP
ncbi:MAG: CHASE2 domain-containing protein [Burkholderiaceae bacterium]